MLATCKQSQRLEKSLSLPALKPKKEITVPEVVEEGERDVEKAKKNLIARGFEKEENSVAARRTKHSLSYARLGFGSKRARTICAQDIY
jgi:hypothetical protein